jgi:hypothetical protein
MYFSFKHWNGDVSRSFGGPSFSRKDINHVTAVASVGAEILEAAWPNPPVSAVSF